MHFTREEITTLKRTPIPAYLNSLGFEPVRQSNGQLVYRSPLTGERSPSFYVHPEKNVFNCFSSGERGDVIRLVTLVEKTEFKPALERLATFNPAEKLTFSFSGQSESVLPPTPPNNSKLVLLDDRALFSPMLMNYVISRGIPPALAKRYLYAIRYQNGNREYEAVGFKTDKDSYALRSKSFKGWLGVSSIRTISIAGSTGVNLFEGFFDFLSALTYYQQLRPTSTTIILNSTTNLKHALSALEGAEYVNCYFDNDNTGRNAVTKLAGLNLPVKDRSAIYRNYNDFNDMLCRTTPILDRWLK